MKLNFCFPSISKLFYCFLRRVASENESPPPQQPVVGKLYQEFNKQRINRGASEPPGVTNEGVAYQMMQMSFHAGRQGITGNSPLGNVHNGYASTPDNRVNNVISSSFIGGGGSGTVFDGRTPQQVPNYARDSPPPPHGIVAKRQIQQAFVGKKASRKSFFFFLLNFFSFSDDGR